MRIAVACPNWIGDAVMATPALAALKKTYPDSEIDLIVRPYVAPVFQPAPYADRLLLWGEGPGAMGLWGLASRMRKLDYEVGLLLANSFRSALLFFLAGVNDRIGYARDGRSFFLTKRFVPLKEHGHYVPMPVMTYYFDLVQSLGVHDSKLLEMKLYTAPRDEEEADRLYARLGLYPQETLVMAPGAAFGLAKCWPPECFAQVARTACDRQGLRTLILCAPKELPVAQVIVDASDGAAIAAPQPLPTIPTVKALVRRARAMVTNDSGLRHFAAAYDLPVVTIFGPTHINWTETWFHKEAKLQASIPCGPCQKRVCPEGHIQCMMEISPDQVSEALAALLAKFPYQAPSEETVVRM